MSNHPPEWQGILDEGEEILWQGGPNHRVQLEFGSPMEAALALFFVGFSLFWMWQAMAGPGPFWMFGLLFLGIGLYKLVGQHFWQARRRRATFYTLTNKCAYIAETTAMGQRTLNRYPIRPDTVLSIQEEGGLSSIHFANEDVLESKPSFVRVNGFQRERTVRAKRSVGFQMIDDGREVFALMRGIQGQREME